MLFLRWIIYKLIIRRTDFHWFYRWYIQSDYWRAKRKVILRRAKGRCERCNKSDNRLEIHHKTYARLGWERQSDLIALCFMCHKIADREREIQGIERKIKRWR